MGSTVPAWLPLAIALTGFLAGAWWVVRGLRGTLSAGRRPLPALDSDQARLVEQLPEGVVERFGRTGFGLYCRLEDSEGAQPEPKLGGRPWLPKGQAWPVCDRCGEALDLLLQLDLDNLPPGGPPQRSGGLAQLFHCFSEPCGGQSTDWPPADASYLARVVDTRLPGGTAEQDLGLGDVGGATITGWEPRLELPDPKDRDALGLPSELCETPGDHLEPAAEDKLGGWPHWRDAAQPANCPTCGGPMELLFQIDSDGCLDIVADLTSPLGHLTRCPTHSTTLAFAWSRAARHSGGFGGVTPST